MANAAEPTAFATLTVRDVMAAAHWYRNVLGFELLSERQGLNGLPIMAHLRKGRDQGLVLVAGSSEVQGGANRLGTGVTLTFVVDDDVDALAARAEASGAQLVDGPVDRPRQVREVTLADADGYGLTFVRCGHGRPERRKTRELNR